MNRFQFVADHSTTFEVKRLCELVEIERSSFYAWVQAAPGREAGRPRTPSWSSGSGRSTPRTTPMVRHGSPPSSTTASQPRSGSTTSGSLG